jgi:phosphatidylglycerophosphatase A
MPEAFTPFGFASRPKKKEGPEPLNGFVQFWVKLVASGFYSGYTPVAPGTAGTLVGVAIWYYFRRIDINPLGIFCLLAVCALIGVGVCTLAERLYNRGDCNIIVIDEIVGFLIAASYLKPGTYENEWRLVLVSFVIFRLLDIVKPFPIRQLEQLPAGWGVMADDVAAGLISLLAVGLPLNSFWVKILDLHPLAKGGS